MKTPRTGIIRVSDHALLKFVERAGGLDVETLRGALEGSMKRAVEVAGKIGTGDLIINADGLQYVVRNNVVVTVVDRVSSRRVVKRP